jgi:DNA-binding transcriptional LysR family regulator
LNLHFNAKRLGLKALPIDLPLPPRPFGIVTLKKRTPSPLVSLFVECARTLAKPFVNARIRF